MPKAAIGMKTPLIVLGALAALAFTTGSASAQIVDNTSLASPNTAAGTPGVYFGAGNQNSNFTVDNGAGGIELGLSAITRFIGPIVPDGSTYNVVTGMTTEPGKTGATWGVDFSIDLNPGGTTNTLKLSDITATLSLTDSNTGGGGSANPLLIPDNTEVGPGGIAVTKDETVDWAVQNSEALSFASVAAALGDPGFDLNAPGTYGFTLTVTCADTVCGGAGTVLGSDSITVVAAPEPASMAILGTALFGLGALRRRRRG